MALNDKYLILESSNKFGGVEYKRTDILSLLHIENISGGALKESASTKRDYSKSKNINVPENTIVITYIIAQVARTLKLVCAHAKQFVTALRYCDYFVGKLLNIMIAALLYPTSSKRRPWTRRRKLRELEQ